MFKTVSISRSEISAGKNCADSIHIPGLTQSHIQRISIELSHARKIHVKSGHQRQKIKL